MKKKLLALLLSGAMILSLTTPVALAEEPEGECCGACDQVECVCPPEEAPCKVCGEIECVCEDAEEPEVPEAPEIPEEPTVCEICGEIECVCEKIEEPEVPEVPEIPEEPTACEKCGEMECVCEGVNDYAELYEALMACESVEEMDALMEELSEEEIDAFFDSLTEEELTALDELFLALAEEVEIEEDTREIVYPTVDYTDAAPFLDPVVGVAPRKRMMFAAPRAADEEPVRVDAKGLDVNKTVSEPDKNGVYTLTLEAWATGKKTTTTITESVPTDIVLVLDQSNSMYTGFMQEISFNKLAATRTPAQLYAMGDTLYTELDDGGYAPVTVIREGSKNSYTYTFTYTDEGGATVTKTVSSNQSAPNWGFYEKDTTNGDRRIEALRTAVGAFVEEVREKAIGEKDDPTDNVKHRIAVVGFGNKASSGTGGGYYPGGGFFPGFNPGASGNQDRLGGNYADTELYIGKETHNYSNLNDTYYNQAFQDMSDDTGYRNVQDSVESLPTEPQGYTYVDLGLDMAEKILNPNLSSNHLEAGEKRNKVVVVFTDGAPGGNPSWEEEGGASSSPATAERAFTIADRLKGNGISVYTVGVFDGANPDNPGAWGDGVSNTNDKANYYMHRVSSNMDGDEVVHEGYYLAASDSVALNEIFKSISENIENGGSSITLGKDAVVKDVITDQFVLPEGTKTSDIKVYTADYTAADTFTNKTLYNAEVDFGEDDQGRTTVSVTNFDFAENWVGTGTDANGNVTSYHGKKLIIEIPVKVNSTALGGEHIPTNDGEFSAVYDGKGTLVEAFPVPYVDIPTTVTVKKLVDGGSAEDFGFTASYDMWAGTYTNIEENGSNYLKANGTTNSESFELGDGKSHAIVDVLVGSEITISEAANSRYHVAKVEVNGEEVEAVDGVYKITVTPGMTITFTNARSVADLKITKTGWQSIDPNQSFIFDVKNSEGKVVNRVTICENGFVVLKNLPVDTYTVEEVENWSWRYSATRYISGGFDETVDALKAETNNSQKVNLANGDQQILVVNERDQIYWLDGNDWCQNIFGENAAIVTPAGKTAVGTAETTEEDEDE